ncbi:MAG: hypothetical protein ACPG31_13100 [Planctomycetota bacterium]
MALLMGGAVSCGGDEKADAPDLSARGQANSQPDNPWGASTGDNPGNTLWDTPPLPEPLRVTVDGDLVPHEVGLAYFTARWSEYCAEEGFGLSAEKLTEGFLADPQALVMPFVRGVVLLREAEARFPELDPEQVEHYRKQMELAAGSASDALIKRYGEDGWERHVERQLRLRMIKVEFATLGGEITDADVYALYEQDVLDKLPNLDPAVGEDVSFENLESRLRARLEVERATEAQEEWIDQQMEGLSVKVELPGDRVEEWEGS